MNRDELRNLPSVHELKEKLLAGTDLPERLVTDRVRRYLDRLRTSIRAGGSCPSADELRREMDDRLEALSRDRIEPVINATGILLHTNLGRSPYAEPARRRVEEVTSGYASLEVSRETGDRGGRGRWAEALVEELTGAAAAAVVNNCSAALYLMLNSLAEGKEVVLSRGEMVQIGGGFRIPEILRESGAKLREIGTTNRTDVEDYERAIGADTACLLKVHRSNFDIKGYGGTPALKDLRPLADQYDRPLIMDLGSGALLDTERWGVRHEPTPEEAIDAGADLVSFSGDKLLGGPQAGLIAGRNDLVESLKQSPLFRALRCGKSTLAALEATLELYVDERVEELPPVRLFDQEVSQLEERANRLRDRLMDRSASDHSGEVGVVETEARVGGGTLPDQARDSRALRLDVDDPERLIAALRRGTPSVFGRVDRAGVVLDLCTVPPDEDDPLVDRIHDVLADE